MLCWLHLFLRHREIQ
jgi:hypothetical protein